MNPKTAPPAAGPGKALQRTGLRYENRRTLTWNTHQESSCANAGDGEDGAFHGSVLLARKVIRKRIEVVQVNPPIEIEVAGDDDHRAFVEVDVRWLTVEPDSDDDKVYAVHFHGESLRNRERVRKPEVDRWHATGCKVPSTRLSSMTYSSRSVS